MILYLDTSSPVCRLWLDDTAFAWEANRELANGLLEFMRNSLSSINAEFSSITGLVTMRGPGSFTGLRIGLTVMNTIAYSNHVPIVGQDGPNWRSDGSKRIEEGQNDEIVLPLYGSEPTITLPKR